MIGGRSAAGDGAAGLRVPIVPKGLRLIVPKGTAPPLRSESASSGTIGARLVN